MNCTYAPGVWPGGVFSSCMAIWVDVEDDGIWYFDCEVASSVFYVLLLELSSVICHPEAAPKEAVCSKEIDLESLHVPVKGVVTGHPLRINIF